MKKTAISTAQAPNAIGPYNQAIRAGEWLFASGQIAIDPKSQEFMHGDIAKQSRQVLKNLQAILDAAGMKLTDVVKTTVYLKNMSDFGVMNTVYAEFFQKECPARATVAVVELPKGALVEIDAIAFASLPD